MICRHCQKRNVNRPRGLCWSCYHDPAILPLYPPSSKYAPLSWLPEPTEEELDAIIAEQMQCLPAWWERSGQIAEKVYMHTWERR